jgi:hypothetical protein
MVPAVPAGQPVSTRRWRSWPWAFSIHVNTLAWLEQRRSIESFFIAEVDRNKIALCGSL